MRNVPFSPSDEQSVTLLWAYPEDVNGDSHHSALVASITRAMKDQFVNVNTGEVLREYEWGYGWSNINALWPVELLPPGVAMLVSPDFGGGEFFADYNIGNLPS